MKVIMFIRHFILNWTYHKSDWILFFDIPPNYPYIGPKMMDAVMKKYKKKGARPVQEFRSKIHAKQRDSEMRVYVWLRIKKELRSAG